MGKPKRSASKERWQRERKKERQRLMAKSKDSTGFSMSDVSEEEMKMARLYLTRVTDINNHLHKALVIKRAVVDELAAEISQLESKISIGKSVAEPARSSCIKRFED